MDKTINLNSIEFTDRKDPANSDAPSNQTLFTNYVGYVVNQAFEKSGLNGDKRRLYNHILEKMDKAIQDTAETLVLNSYEYLFLKDAFEKATIEPKNTLMVTKVENAILSA